MEEVQQHTSMPRETRQIQNTLQCQVQIRIRENANKNTRKCRIFLNNQTYLFLSAPLTQGGQLILTNFALNRSLKVFPIEIDQETKSILIVYSIFALYRDTKTIHSIMMIWLVIFIISNYNLASGPPKDPGGVKKHIFKIKGH